MLNKEFKKYRKLVDILKNKGFSINDESSSSKIISVIEQENYYNLFNGYKDLFIDKEASNLKKSDVVKNGTDFFELKALYDFDREIRFLFLKYILIIENKFKSALSYEFSAQYGHDNYLKLDNFNRNNLQNVTKLIGEIHQTIASQFKNNNSMIVHYITKYGYVPLWVLVNVLSFGSVSRLYSSLKDSDKINIAKRFNIPFDKLDRYMKMLCIARNKCAHDERFYNIRFKDALHTNSIKGFNTLKIPKDKSGSYKMGINDVFAIVVIFKLIVGEKDFDTFVNELNLEFEKLTNDLKTVSLSDVQASMGFVSNWKDIISL